MKRREFISLVGGAAALAPFSARAQQAMPVIGLLSGTEREPRDVAAIQKGLAEAGFTEGRDIIIDYRWAAGRFDQLPALAAELVRRPANVIIAISSATSPLAAKAATSTIPIVFSIGGDPVRLGLVASLNRPGGNVTGTSFLVNSLGAKRLEYLRELAPQTSSIGLLVNPKNPNADTETADVQSAARTLGVDIHIERASNEAEIDAAFSKFVSRRIGALTFASDAVFSSQSGQLIALASRHRMPTMYFLRHVADAGGLMSYGGDRLDAYRLAGIYAGRILKGEKPQDLPVQQSTKVELVINLKTAKDQGIEIPLALIGRADEVIE